MDKFVDEWNIIQTLGEGAYGEVKLLVHQKSGEAVAMKVVDLRKCKDAKINVLKEEKIHRLMVHSNVIRLLGKREEPNMVYIFLEYAAGGELFNKIEPDVGMYPGHAQKYMKQLLSGLDYLHSKGIAHRDIKPENLLLDECGVLKISDFGLATVFRLKGKERLLDRKCGTLPYVAPEVLEKPYRAQPTDLWSCGIVFVAMLAGELPWDEPRSTCKEYVQWKSERCITQTPWSKLGNNALSLAIKVLSPEPSERFTLQQIVSHPWMNMRFPNADYDNADDEDETDTKEPEAKRNPSISELGSVQKMPAVTLSQPISRPKMLAIEPKHLAALTNKDKICFSQPAQNVEDLLISSQIQCTQSPLTQNNFEKLVKRMTRFFVKTPYEKTITHLCKALDILYLSWTTDPSGVVSISTTDARKMPLEFKANIIDMDCKLLLDFRLSKGCGLEFKRLFMKIKKLLSDIAES